MMKRPNSLWLMVAVVAIVVAVAQVAEAQRGEGRRGPDGPGFRGPGGPGGGMPVSAAQLAANPRVQEALDLREEQIEKIAEINDDLRQKARDAFGERREFGEVRSQMEKLRDEATADLKEVLDDDQQKRLAGILIQANEAGALADPLVADMLDLTDEQKAEVADIRETQMRELREQLRGERPRDLSREQMREMREKLEQRRDEANQQLKAVLTSEQQSEFESLRGEPVDLGRQRFGGGSRFEGRERRGDREPGERRGRGARRGDRAD